MLAELMAWKEPWLSYWAVSALKGTHCACASSGVPEQPRGI